MKEEADLKSAFMEYFVGLKLSKLSTPIVSGKGSN